MISSNRSYLYLRLLSTLNCAPCAACVWEKLTAPNRHAEQVCPRLTWPMTYLKRPDPRSTSPICWPVSSLPFPSPSIAKAWSPLSPKKSPAATASCAPTRTPSLCARTLDDSACCVPRYCCRLALGLPSTAHLPSRRSSGPRLVGLPGTPLFVPHHLVLGRSESQLERGILSPLALPVAAPRFVRPHSAPRSGLLPLSLCWL